MKTDQKHPSHKIAYRDGMHLSTISFDDVCSIQEDFFRIHFGPELSNNTHTRRQTAAIENKILINVNRKMRNFIQFIHMNQKEKKTIQH